MPPVFRVQPIDSSGKGQPPVLIATGRVPVFDAATNATTGAISACPWAPGGAMTSSDQVREAVCWEALRPFCSILSFGRKRWKGMAHSQQQRPLEVARCLPARSCLPPPLLPPLRFRPVLAAARHIRGSRQVRQDGRPVPGPGSGRCAACLHPADFPLARVAWQRMATKAALRLGCRRCAARLHLI